MFPIPPTISANTQEVAMIAMQRKQKMEQRVVAVMEQGNQALNNLHILMMKAQSFPQIDLNPLTQQDQFCSYLTKLDLICLFLEDFNALYRNFVMANSLDTPPRQEMAVAHQSSPLVMMGRPMLEGPPLRFVNNFPIHAHIGIMHGPMCPVPRFPGPSVQHFSAHPPHHFPMNSTNNHPPSAQTNTNIRASAPEFVPVKSTSTHGVIPQAKPARADLPGASSAVIPSPSVPASPSPQALPHPQALPNPQALPSLQTLPSPQVVHASALKTTLLQPVALHTGQQSRPSRPGRHKKENDMFMDLSSQSSLDVQSEDNVPVTRVSTLTKTKTPRAPDYRQGAASAVPAEPVQTKRKMDALEAAFVDCKVDEDDPTVSGLPSQEVLDLDATYQCILSYQGTPSEFYIIVNPMDHLGFAISRLTQSMDEYYSCHQVDVRPLLPSMSYCAVYQDSEWFRCFIVNIQGEDSLQVYFVDMGGIDVVPMKAVQPLVPRFCDKPPYARVCHLTGVEPVGGEWSEEANHTLNELHCSELLKLIVDDNSSESLGVTLYLGDHSINQLLIDNGFAVPNTPSPLVNGHPPRPKSRAVVSASSLAEDVPTRDTNAHVPQTPDSADLGRGSMLNATSPQQIGSTEDSALLDQWNIMDCPEYTDPLMAVQGYSNRDEAEICKFYKGPPHTSCFKGSNCKKKHITIHPDGWTQDKVEVTQKPEPLMLPAAGTRLPVYVTCVDSYKRFYIQIPDLDASKEKQNEFLPALLKDLIRKMNSVSVVQSIAPLPMMPSRGELVAAWYPDKKLYRAQVLHVEQETLRVQVYYVDFGNTAWTMLNQVYELEPQFATLPFQAVPCFLADIALKNNMVDKVKAMDVIKSHILEKRLIANVIGMASADTLLVELEDAGGFSVAETAITQHARLFHHQPDSRDEERADKASPAKGKVVHLPG